MITCRARQNTAGQFVGRFKRLAAQRTIELMISHCIPPLDFLYNPVADSAVVLTCAPVPVRLGSSKLHWVDGLPATTFSRQEAVHARPITQNSPRQRANNDERCGRVCPLKATFGPLPARTYLPETEKSSLLLSYSASLRDELNIRRRPSVFLPQLSEYTDNVFESRQVPPSVTSVTTPTAIMPPSSSSERPDFPQLTPQCGHLSPIPDEIATDRPHLLQLFPTTSMRMFGLRSWEVAFRIYLGRPALRAPAVHSCRFVSIRGAKTVSPQRLKDSKAPWGDNAHCVDWRAVPQTERH
jgi:hypothetical protein